MYVYTEQQESSVLATINLEKRKKNEKCSKKCRVIIVFLLLNVCTYVHHCDLTPICCRRHLLMTKQAKIHTFVETDANFPSKELYDLTSFLDFLN